MLAMIEPQAGLRGIQCISFNECHPPLLFSHSSKCLPVRLVAFRVQHSETQRTGTCPALFERVQNGKGLLLLAACVSLVASRWFWLPRCVAGRSLLAPVTRSLHALTTCGAPLGGLTNHTIENGFVLFDAEHLPTVGFLEVRAASRTDCHFTEFFIFGGLLQCH